ncbi:Gti1/Pac2 family-domain-containing protein [Lophiotrema nucula]|uniref:Gti1/Pac2 family-domain-containing protein n=1 Tax=Lophiotrema nucula TaxID=690887 RepID=A0A6A5Z715_9PLEO|nr:Gti1/Pac2 family-domain-containing protein [Lophiotrema nucula]
METYHGHVRTPSDAIILFEACRLGLLPRVQRRLSEKERQQIKSGSIFVWDEREAGMRRWTDGKSWSASRVSGSFLTYREMEGKRGGSSFPSAPPVKKPSGKSPDGSATGDSGDEGPDGYRYKPDGLMKQSFSITTSAGQHLHLISYFTRPDPTQSGLQTPAQDPSLRHIRPQKNMYPDTTVNETNPMPAVTRSPMSGSPYNPAANQMGPSSPYSRPGTQPQMFLPPNYPHTPMGTPPIQYAYYPTGAYPVVYAPQGFVAHPSQFDRAPPALQHPHQIPGHPMLAAAHPAHYAQQFIAHPHQARMQPTEIAHQPQHHLPAASQSLPEQGPRLPALNGIPPLRNDNKPPSPQPTVPKSQDSLNVATASNAAVNEPSPARTVPTLGALLNGHPTEAADSRSNSRSGSRSPNAGAQRPLVEIPGDRIASNSRLTDANALQKLNTAMFTARS